MFKHSKGGNFFPKYMDKKLPCFYAYGYYMIVVNVSKNNNICEQNSSHITIYFNFHMWQMDGYISKTNI
jgi:hypothetical protein